MPEETNIEMDVPREGEYLYETLFGETGASAESISFYPPVIQNQGAKYKTRMACTRYGMVHAINAQNRAVAEVDGMRWYEIPAEGIWLNFLKVEPTAEKDGATLQGALDQFLSIGYITGYSRLNSQEEMKASLLAFKPIFTGSINGDWSYVRDEKKYRIREDGRKIGHAFCIVGFDGLGWIAINSYGISNGVFHIPYELTSTLFSRYSLSDSRDTAVFARLKK